MKFFMLIILFVSSAVFAKTKEVITDPVEVNARLQMMLDLDEQGKIYRVGSMIDINRNIELGTIQIHSLAYSIQNGYCIATFNYTPMLNNGIQFWDIYRRSEEFSKNCNGLVDNSDLTSTCTEE